MIEKQVASLADAVADVADGSTVMIGGFGTAGLPNELVGALLEQGAKNLTIVNNNAGNGDTGLAALLATGNVPRRRQAWRCRIPPARGCRASSGSAR